MRRRPPARASAWCGAWKRRSISRRQPDFVEQPSLRRSNAHAIVAAEVAATRAAAGCSIPASTRAMRCADPRAQRGSIGCSPTGSRRVGRMRLAPMLAPSGKLMGDLTVARLASRPFWLVGSYYLQEWHLRWFRDHLPGSRRPHREPLGELARILALGPALARHPRAPHARGCRRCGIAVPRVPPPRHRTDAGHGRAPLTHRRARLRDQRACRPAARAVGRAASSRARRSACSPSACAPRIVCASKRATASGRSSSRQSLHRRPCRASTGSSPSTRGNSSAARRRSPSAQTGPAQRLVLLAIDATDADVTGFEPVWRGRTQGRLRHLGRLRPSRQAEPGARLRRPRDRRSSVSVTVHVVGEAAGGADTRGTALRSAGPQAPRVTPARAPKRTTA